MGAKGDGRREGTGPQTLLDRAEIQDVVNRVSLLSDARDWEALRPLLADEVGVDPSPLDGGEPATMEAGELVDAWRAVSNHVVTVHEQHELATCSAYLQAHHYLLNYEGSDRWSLGGRQDYDLARTPGGWKIRAFGLTVLWASGNRHLPELARRRFEEGLAERIGPR